MLGQNREDLDVIAELTRKGRVDQAFQQISNLIITSPDDEDLWFRRAWMAVTYYPLQESLRELKTFEEKFPGKSAEYLWAMAHAEVGDWETSMYHLDRADDLGLPKDYSVRIRAAALVGLGMSNKAKELVKDALERNPSDLEIIRAAIVTIPAENEAEMNRYADKLSLSGERPEHILCFRAGWYKKQSEPENAATLYQQSRETFPENRRISFESAVCEADQGDLDSAITRLEHLLQLSKSDVEFSEKLLEFYWHKLESEPELAEQQMLDISEKLSRLDVPLESAHLFRGDWYASKGGWLKAIPEFEQALDKAPDSEPAILRLANALHHSGDDVRALSLYQLAQDVNPLNKQTADYVAYSLRKNGKYWQAIKAIDKYGKAKAEQLKIEHTRSKQKKTVH